MPDRPNRRPNVVLLVIAAVAVLAIVVVIIGTVGGDDDDSTSTAAGVEQNRAVEITGTHLATYDSSGADPAVGAAAPVVRGQSFAGETVTIGGTGPALVVFVAHWCPHCQREVPFLVDYFEEHGMPEGIDVFGVSTAVTSQRPNYPPSAWLSKEGWTPPTLADSVNGEAADAFGLSAFPYFVAIDKDGKIAARGTGELEAPQLEALIAAATSG